VKQQRTILLCLLFLGMRLPLSAQNPSLPENPSDMIGMTLEQAADLLGLPVRVYASRGEESWQDDVVFVYDDHVSLYWFQDRVWQVRFDPGFEGSAGGLKIGTDREQVSRVLGVSPSSPDEDGEVFVLSRRGIPLRLQVFYREGRVYDVYLYRGDF